MGRYVRELLTQLGGRDDLELTVVVPQGADAQLAATGATNIAETIVLPTRDALTTGLWERYRLGGVLSRRGVEVVHGTKHLVPRTSTLPSVLTVHDMLLLTWSSMFTPMKRSLLPRQYRASLADATVLLAVSEATARRLVGLMPEVADKVVVATEGVSVDLLTVATEPVPALVDRRFALVVGDLSPRKNLDLLSGIWDAVAEATGATLVSAGPDGWRSEDVLRRFDGLVARGTALRLRDLPDAQLRWCYEHAAVVLLPTLEEGFGLPIVEALALGAPVVASTDPALVEAAHGYATHLDARDADAWARTVTEVLRSPRVATAVPHDVLPSWRDHADRVVDAYRRAIAFGESS
jgi:glycosyltransferase involved in cell wall biosynthesis